MRANKVWFGHFVIPLSVLIFALFYQTLPCNNVAYFARSFALILVKWGNSGMISSFISIFPYLTILTHLHSQRLTKLKAQASRLH